MKENAPEGEPIGWQILNAEGFNIHGDEDDPFEITSFAVLTGDAVEAARAWVASNPGYSLAPVREGDIEKPEFVGVVPAASQLDATP